MIEHWESILLSIVFTLVGAGIGARASIRGARLTAEKQQLYIESAKFIEAFIREIIALRKATEDAYKILGNEAMERHMKAKVKFEAWIPKKKKNSFEQDWEQYEKSIKTTSPGRVDVRKAECKAALRQVEQLLSYAKTKG